MNENVSGTGDVEAAAPHAGVGACNPTVDAAASRSVERGR